MRCAPTRALPPNPYVQSHFRTPSQCNPRLKLPTKLGRRRKGDESGEKGGVISKGSVYLTPVFFDGVYGHTPLKLAHPTGHVRERAVNVGAQQKVVESNGG